jgi:H(+)-translocating pyrophosphatase
MIIIIALSFTALLHLPGTIFSICLFVLTATAFGAFFSYWLAGYVFGKDDGTPEMRAVSDPIKEGSEGFLKIQYAAITKMASLVCLLIMGSYSLRPSGTNDAGIEAIGNGMLGFVSTLAFIAGATCSASVGYVSMWVSASTNIRVCSAARRSYSEALDICFRGGAFSAVLCITLCVFGVTTLFLSLHFVFVTTMGVLVATDLPMLMVGFGFGASFVALFMQLGGGIYTKAADVGADMVGKIEIGIPEDDPRNPAVIADLVGDMVGDCVGSSADIFESVAAEIIGAMILGATLAKEEGLENPVKFVLFPLCVHAVDIVVSSIGVLTLKAGPLNENPMNAITRSYRITAFCAFLGFVGCCRLLLHLEDKPTAWMHFALCGLIGICNGYIFIQSTQYFTDYEFQPVRDIAAASVTGHGTNIITGMAVGLKSTVIPVISVSISVLIAYHVGAATGIGTQRSAGLFGTAVATMGMLSSAVYVLAMNNFGPIADNAGGIAEMSQQPEGVRLCTDKLDACGNVTKAITKGYSIGSAALACFLLFGAFMDEFSTFSGVPFTTVDIAVPEVNDLNILFFIIFLVANIMDMLCCYH